MSRSRFLVLLRTVFSLGVCNVFRVAFYRVTLRFGLSKAQRVYGSCIKGPYFKGIEVGCFKGGPIRSNILASRVIPNWHFSELSNPSAEFVLEDWWKIPDFDSDRGDIKLVWKSSRFDWILSFAQSACGGDDDAIKDLNAWLEDWSIHNPPYKGPNWKCGQEASIRVMHLAMGALLLEQVNNPAPKLLQLIQLHLQRIEPTLSYAMAQDNNHGTSEAAALFIGGGWLKAQGMAEGERWLRLGHKWLENRAVRLIGKDGSFSQYSLNYHRLMLDTFCMVEVWRRHMQLPEFSSDWYGRSLAASEWLYAMISPLNGDGPNLGANDGARLLPLTDTDYRDFRPSVQLAMALFANAQAYAAEGLWNLPLRWLSVELPQTIVEQPISRQFDDGGFAVLRCGSVMAMLRYPRFRFRPSQADALHLDLWLGGRNLLRDAGTYSYNTETQWLNYFPGTASHNTIQFDDRDQMPRISRFLFGGWLRTSYLEPLHVHAGVINFAAGYRDRKKVSHRRSVRLNDHSLQVDDLVDGFQRKAVLRWRLEPGQWLIEGSCLSNGEHVIQVKASVPIVRFELTDGWESRYYLEKKQVPVLEVEIQQPGLLITEYRWLS